MRENRAALVSIISTCALVLFLSPLAAWVTRNFLFFIYLIFLTFFIFILVISWSRKQDDFGTSSKFQDSCSFCVCKQGKRCFWFMQKFLIWCADSKWIYIPGKFFVFRLSALCQKIYKFRMVRAYHVWKTVHQFFKLCTKLYLRKVKKFKHIFEEYIFLRVIGY